MLVQVGRNMVLTPLALSLCDPVRDVLLQIQSTIETKPAFVPKRSKRHFRLIASNFPTMVLLADVAQHLSWHAPNISMEIMSPTESSQEQLDRGEVDLLIMPEKYVNVDGHPSETLFEDSYSCVVWASNTVVGDTLTLEQYMELSHVSTTFGGQRQTSFEEWFLQKSGLSRRIDVTTNDFNTLPHMVIGTNRIATMHRRLARMFANYYPLRLIEPPMPIPTMVEVMQWHRYLDQDPGHVWFRGLLRTIASSEKMYVEGF